MPLRLKIFGGNLIVTKFDVLYLHGFWGRGEEAPEFLAELRKSPQSREILAPDLFVEGPLGPHSSLNSWASAFASELRKNCGLGDESKDSRLVVVGYSMGARLAINL